MKNILIISYISRPANTPTEQRSYAIAKYLDKTKFNVNIITCGNADSSLGLEETFNKELKEVNFIKIDAPFGSKSGALREHK